MTVRLQHQLAHVDDDELERLCASWRARARHGDREAFGIAHALEVEQRRRARASQMQSLTPEPTPTRVWWKFWQVGNDQLPITAT